MVLVSSLDASSISVNQSLGKRLKKPSLFRMERRRRESCEVPGISPCSCLSLPRRPEQVDLEFRRRADSGVGVSSFLHPLLACSALSRGHLGLSRLAVCGRGLFLVLVGGYQGCCYRPAMQRLHVEPCLKVMVPIVR